MRGRQARAHLPLVVALKEGYFKDAGLNVTLVEPADHWEAEEEIIAGRLDVAVTETLHLAQDAARGKPVIGFSRFLHTDGGVMYLKGKGIERPSDMCGKTISYPGYPGPGGPAPGPGAGPGPGPCKVYVYVYAYVYVYVDVYVYVYVYHSSNRGRTVHIGAVIQLKYGSYGP